MQESYWDDDFQYSKNENFSPLTVSPDTPFFAQIDGRRFQPISEKVGPEKPFGVRFAKCLAVFGRALFESSFNARAQTTRRQIKENWNLPIFFSKEGQDLIRRILKWVKPHCR
jgi:hypothetical protein